MAPQTDAPGLGYCMSCGGPAVVTGRSLDARWLAGYCSPADDAIRRCPPPVMVTVSADEAAAVRTVLHERNVARGHKRHDPKRPNPACSHCRAMRRLAQAPLTGPNAAGTQPAGTPEAHGDTQ